MDKLFIKRKIALFSALLITGFSAMSQKLEKVAPIAQELINSNINTIHVKFEGKLYFTAPGTAGMEWWVTDGTTEETKILKDINPGSAGSDPSNVVIFQDQLFFTAFNPEYGLAIWKSDGSEEGTQLFMDINPGVDDYSTSSLNVIGDKLVFISDDGTGRELWSSDGTVAGTVILKKIYAERPSLPALLTSHNNHIYFTIKNDQGFAELWKTDGTESGTNRIRTFEYVESAISFLNGKEETLYFKVNNGYTLQELWSTDGTLTGTEMIKQFAAFSQIGAFAILNETLFFGLDSIGSSQIWKSDGTLAGTKKISNIASTMQAPIGELTPFQDKIFFRGGNENGFELWVSDGTSEGTFLFREIGPGPESAMPTILTVFSDKLYFRATEGFNRDQLWVTNGTVAGTKTLYPETGPTDNTPLINTTRFYIFENYLYLLANYDQQSTDLWKIEGDVTSVQSQALSASFVFPNPANDILNFMNTSITGIKITTLQGDELLNEKNPAGIQQTSISHLPDGVYVLSTYNNNRLLANVRLIKN